MLLLKNFDGLPIRPPVWLVGGESFGCDTGPANDCTDVERPSLPGDCESSGGCGGGTCNLGFSGRVEAGSSVPFWSVLGPFRRGKVSVTLGETPESVKRWRRWPFSLCKSAKAALWRSASRQRECLSRRHCSTSLRYSCLRALLRRLLLRLRSYLDLAAPPGEESLEDAIAVAATKLIG